MTDLIERLKQTNVTASSHSDVLFQFGSQLKLKLYTSSADIAKDLRETAGLRSDSHLSIFLNRLYSATANFFRTHRGFRTVRNPTAEQTLFAKDLI